MRNEPARLGGISLDFARIPPRWDGNFPYEHTQVGLIFVIQEHLFWMMALRRRLLLKIVDQTIFSSDITNFLIELNRWFHVNMG